MSRCTKGTVLEMRLSPNWIPDDVVLDSTELLRTAHDPIIALMLPEGLPLPAKFQIRFPGGPTFELIQDNRRVNEWCNQKVRMIGHDGPSV